MSTESGSYIGLEEMEIAADKLCSSQETKNKNPEEGEEAPYLESHTRSMNQNNRLIHRNSQWENI